jgi:hydroxymethylglutaryl-CoA lyase
MRVKIIECPRDAMQGLDWFVPTQTKVDYLNALLKVGYHTIDCGSFVSPKAIPQMRDTSELLDKINDPGDTGLSVIVANLRGIESAVKQPRVNYLGYPFSISETFQQRNTNNSIESSLEVVDFLITTSHSVGKEVVIYISMGFGNPYEEEWNVQMVVDWVGKIAELGVTSFSISDTVGVSTPDKIEAVFKSLNSNFDNLEFGAHFHTRPDNWLEKIEAAWKNGCQRFDGAIAGFGGCPMADDELVGNMPTENVISFFEGIDQETGLDKVAFESARKLAASIFT